MDLFLLLVIVPIWLVAIVYAYLEVRDGLRLYRDRRRFQKIIDNQFESQGRPRLGLRQEED